MAKLTRDDLAKIANLPDNVRADLAALFSDIEDRDQKIATMSKEKADADVIVKRAPELEKAVKDRDDKIAILTGELEKHKVTPPADDSPITLSAFASFFR